MIKLVNWINAHFMIFLNYIIFIFKGYSKLGDMKSAEEVISTMHENAINPDRFTYGSLMLGYAVNGDDEGVLRILNKPDLIFPVEEYFKVIQELVMKNKEELAHEVYLTSQNYYSNHMQLCLGK